MSENSGVPSLVFNAFVGGVHLSPALLSLPGRTFFYNKIGVACIKAAGMTIYEHRERGEEAIYYQADGSELIEALDQPASVKVMEKNGKSYINLFPVEKKERERYPAARNPYYHFFLLRFPDGYPLEIRYKGAFWSKETMSLEEGQSDIWDAELLAITSGRLSREQKLPLRSMIFRPNGEDKWFVLGSRVTLLDELGELEPLES